MAKEKDKSKELAKKKKASKDKKKSKKVFTKVDDPFKVIKYVLMTEKAIQSIELENKLVFIVDSKSTKNSIKMAIEAAFKSEIHSVKVLNDQKGRKKAIIRFVEEGVAGDIAMRLGML